MSIHTNDDLTDSFRTPLDALIGDPTTRESDQNMDFHKLQALRPSMSSGGV